MAQYVTRNSRFQPEIDEKRVNRILDRVRSGMSAGDIASSMGISTHTVRRIVKEHGGIRNIRNST